MKYIFLIVFFIYSFKTFGQSPIKVDVVVSASDSVYHGHMGLTAFGNFTSGYLSDYDFKQILETNFYSEFERRFIYKSNLQIMDEIQNKLIVKNKQKADRSWLNELGLDFSNTDLLLLVYFKGFHKSMGYSSFFYPEIGIHTYSKLNKGFTLIYCPIRVEIINPKTMKSKWFTLEDNWAYISGDYDGKSISSRKQFVPVEEIQKEKSISKETWLKAYPIIESMIEGQVDAILSNEAFITKINKVLKKK